MDGWFGVPVEELPRVAELEYALPSGAKQFVPEVCPSYERVLEYPRGLVELDRINSAEFRTSVFGAIKLHASAQALAKFYSALTRKDGPVRKLLGQSLHDEYLASQACGSDETVGLTVNWTLGLLRTSDFIGLGGLGGSAAWWSLRHNHGVSYVNRRLHDHSRAAQIASALGDTSPWNSAVAKRAVADSG